MDEDDCSDEIRPVDFNEIDPLSLRSPYESVSNEANVGVINDMLIDDMECKVVSIFERNRFLFRLLNFFISFVLLLEFLGGVRIFTL